MNVARGFRRRPERLAGAREVGPLVCGPALELRGIVEDEAVEQRASVQLHRVPRTTLVERLLELERVHGHARAESDLLRVGEDRVVTEGLVDAEQLPVEELDGFLRSETGPEVGRELLARRRAIGMQREQSEECDAMRLLGAAHRSAIGVRKDWSAEEAKPRCGGVHSWNNVMRKGADGHGAYPQDERPAHQVSLRYANTTVQLVNTLAQLQVA